MYVANFARNPLFSPRSADQHEAALAQVRTVLGRRHGFDPKDEGALWVWDTVKGAVEVGVKWLTVYAFSTENWSRPPSEVRYLMNFNRGLLQRRRDGSVIWTRDNARAVRSLHDNPRRAWKRDTVQRASASLRPCACRLLSSSDTPCSSSNRQA